MQTINSNKAFNIVNKIPKGLLFNQKPDRQQALLYYNYLKANVPDAQALTEDQLIRLVIAHELRVVSMKTIEPTILLVIGLNNTSISDLTCNNDDLLSRIIFENQSKFDLDTMQRVLAQIMTKLPRDLKDRVTGRQKRELFQAMSKFIGIKDNLLEKFVNYDPTVNDNTTVTMELDQGDYNTLNKKFLNNVNAREQKNLFIPNNELEFAKSIKSTVANGTLPTTNGLKAQYIDMQPTLMRGVKDNKMYYFDESSNVLTEIQPNSSSAVKVSAGDLENILINQKVDKAAIADLLKNLNDTQTTIDNQNGILSNMYNYVYTAFYGNNTSNNDSPYNDSPYNEKTSGISSEMRKYIKHKYAMKNSSNLYNTGIQQLYNKYYTSDISNEYNDYEREYENAYPTIDYSYKYHRRRRSATTQPATTTTRQAITAQSPVISGTTTTTRSPTTTTYSAPPTTTTTTRSPTTTLAPAVSGTTTTTLAPAVSGTTTTTRSPTTTYSAPPPPTTTYSAPPPPTTTYSAPPPTTTRSPTTTYSAPPPPTTTYSAPPTTTLSGIPTTTYSAPPTTTTRSPTTSVASPFKNIEGFTMNEREQFENMKNEHNDIEHTAIGFVVVLILLFLLIIFISIRNKK